MGTNARTDWLLQVVAISNVNGPFILTTNEQKSGKIRTSADNTKHKEAKHKTHT